MPIPRRHRFPVEFTDVFPGGLLLLGQITEDTEYQPDPTRTARQNIDDVEGVPVWRASVTDPGESNPRRASFALLLLSAVLPEPLSPEISPQVRRLVVEGLTAEPRLMGQNPYKYLGFVYRATRIVAGVATPATSAASAAAGKPPVGAGSRGKESETR